MGQTYGKNSTKRTRGGVAGETILALATLAGFGLAALAPTGPKPPEFAAIAPDPAPIGAGSHQNLKKNDLSFSAPGVTHRAPRGVSSGDHSQAAVPPAPPRETSSAQATAAGVHPPAAAFFTEYNPLREPVGGGRNAPADHSPTATANRASAGVLIPAGATPGAGFRFLDAAAVGDTPPAVASLLTDLSSIQGRAPPPR